MPFSSLRAPPSLPFRAHADRCVTRDSGNGANKQGEVYQRIIQEVIDTSVIDFEEAGVNASTLEELKQVSWVGTISSFHSLVVSFLYPLLWAPLLRGRFYTPWDGCCFISLFFFFAHISLPIRAILLVFGTIGILVTTADNRLIHRFGSKGFRIFTSLISHGIQHHRKLPHHRRPRLSPLLPLKPNPSKLASSKSLTPTTLLAQQDKMSAASASNPSLAWSRKVFMPPRRRVTQHTTPRSPNRGPAKILRRSLVTHFRCGPLAEVVD